MLAVSLTHEGNALSKHHIPGEQKLLLGQVDHRVLQGMGWAQVHELKHHPTHRQRPVLGQPIIGKHQLGLSIYPRRQLLAGRGQTCFGGVRMQVLFARATMCAPKALKTCKP